MTRTLAIYFLQRLGISLFVAAVVVFGLIALVDFVEATRQADPNEGFTSLDLFGLTLLKTPSLVEQTLPFILLFAIIGTLHGLNRRSELIAARAAGLSAWQYLRPALMTAALFGVAWVALGNPLASTALARHDAIREAASGMERDEQHIWLREATESQRTVIRAEGYDPASRTLLGVTYFAFERDGDSDRFDRRIDAKSARWLPTGYFQLEDLREYADDSYGELVDALSVPTTLTERQIIDRVDTRGRGERLPPVWQLPALISAQADVGFSTLLPRMKLWRLAALPLLLVAMTVIGATVSMRLSREGGTWRLILTGAAVGFAVFFATVFVEAFGEVGMIPPIVAVWTVPIVALLVGIAYLSQLEDG